MKTKIKYIIWYLFFIFSGFQTYANLSLQDGVTPSTSWVQYSYYDVEWCSPHAWRLADNRFSSTQLCQKWYFHNVWWVGKMTYKWENFANGNVKLNSAFPSTTRTSGSNFINFFDGINTIAFEWEWTYTIRILLVDYAFNASKFEFTYKIDKTAPQFQLTWILDDTNHPNIYVDDYRPRILWLNGNIVKYDSNLNISENKDLYNNPDLRFLNNTYSWDIPQVRTWHERQDLYTVYFRDIANHPFKLNLKYDDTYSWHMTWWLEYISGVKNFDLMPETWDIPLKTGISLSTAISIMTNELEKSGVNTHPENSQKKYRLRLYDNTEGKDGWKSNYSEVVFYAVRDNTKPNMLAGSSDTSSAIQKLVWFTSNTTAWDTLSNNKDVAKFISATAIQQLYSELKDIWIWWNVASKYAWYNSWIPISSTKIQIESSSDKNVFSDVFSYDNRFTNLISKWKNFSKVDNDRVNGYRKYTTNFITNWQNWKICDNVWNCLEPKLDFRVVANILSKNNSNINLTKSQDLTFANGQDNYIIEVQLKDAYDNSIVWVQSVDNPSSPELKDVEISFDFTNGLFSQAYTTEWNWTKQAIVEDKLSSKNQPSTLSTINNTDSTISFKEKIEWTYDSNNWTYKFSVASRVPTVWAYKYLDESIALSLDSINSKANNKNVSWVGFYPNSTSSLWIYQDSTSISGNTQFVAANTNFINSSDYRNDLVLTEKTNYGKTNITIPTSNFATLWTKKMQLEFASPVVYGWSGFTIQHLVGNIWQKSAHDKWVYKLSGVEGVKVIEQYLPSYLPTSQTNKKYTPGIFNIFNSTQNDLDSTTIINSWTTISLGATLASTPSNYENSYYTKSSPIQANYQVNWYGFNMWYVSFISYNLDWVTITIPSISRNVSNDINASNWNIWSKYYLLKTQPLLANQWNWEYVILWDPIVNTWIQSAMWIAVTGLTNSYEWMIIDTEKWRKANLKVWENLTRYDLMTLFKQNIVKNSRWITWCNWLTISDLNDQSNLNSCTVTLNGEKISFIKWNVDIDCWANCKLEDNIKRTIIVKDGSTYIKSNITNFGNKSQFLIWTIADSWLKNIDIWTTINPTLIRDNKVFWWTLIDPKVTNIDAFLVAQWPMVSYENGILFNEPNETQLKNQLHVYGSTLSLNTIWWYNAENSSKCPYIVQNCDQKTSFIFDLVTLRRYSLEWVWTGSINVIPSGNWKRSGWKITELTTDGGSPATVEQADTCLPWDGTLRCITDTDYIIYPLFVERDVNWNKSPSVMFRTDR